MVAALPEDEFDRWCVSRDQYLERATAPAHVSHDVYGTEDWTATAAGSTIEILWPGMGPASRPGLGAV